MAFQPGLPGSQFQGQSEDYLVRRVQDLEKAVQQLAAANVFAPMGVTPTPDGFTVTGTETVTGALIVNGPETVNGALNVNGAMAVTGTLSLPAGIIGNDALAAPATFGQASQIAVNFPITVAEASVATTTIPVPPGYSKANVSVTVAVGAVNSTGAADYIYVRASINGSGANSMFAYAGPTGGTAWAGSTKTATLTGLSGGNITLDALASTQGGTWAANAVNRAFVEATVTFLR